MAEIVNLNRVRKRRRRAAKRTRAKEGRSRDRPGAEAARVRREHDGKRLDPS